MSYPFVFPPYRHQEREFLAHKDSRARALLWQMRSGKTKVVIDTACYNHVGLNIDGVLVLAPNGVHSNWVLRELPKHHWKLPRRAQVWSSSRRTGKGFQESFRHLCGFDGLAWFAVNHDAMKTEAGKAHVAAFLKARRRVLLIVDESHDFGTPGSKRTLAVRALARDKRVVMCRILSGTAVDESPLKAYSQFELLQPGALGFTRAEDYRKRYVVYRTNKNRRTGKTFETVDHYQHLDELRERIAQWSSVVLRSDCDDMPELVMGTIGFEMLPSQRKLYDDMTAQMMLRLDSGEVIPPLEGGVLAMRLQQVSTGYVVDDEGKLHWIVKPEENPRLGALQVALEREPCKTIVWCRFQPELDLVREALKRWGVSSVEYHGRVNERNRNLAIDRFQNDPSVRVFLGQPDAGGAGLDLSAAGHVVWFSHVFRAIARGQANERATQIGGKRVALTDLVCDDGRDTWVLECLAEKRDVADALAGRGLKDFLESNGSRI